VDDRLARAPVVVLFAGAVRTVAGVRAFYVHGSLASGHYRPGISDLDLVAVVERDLDGGQRERLADLHRTIARDHPAAATLHCAYVPHPDVDDVDREHLVWAHGELYRRTLSGIARAEIHQFGITVYGPPPAEIIPPVSPAALRAAARAELTGYWSGVVQKFEPWLQDTFVDHGLTALARARETILTGRLTSKDEAIAGLGALGVPPHLARRVRLRREGHDVPLTAAERHEQAVVTRQIMIEQLGRMGTVGL